MASTLDPAVEEMIRQKVAVGLYPDAETALSQAMRLLEEHDRTRQRLLDALAEGDRGEATPVTPQVLDALYQSAIRRAAAGETPHPDVLP